MSVSEVADLPVLDWFLRNGGIVICVSDEIEPCQWEKLGHGRGVAASSNGMMSLPAFPQK